MTLQWGGESGDARKTLFADEDAGIITILTGMGGSLSYGEQAGERMRLA